MFAQLIVSGLSIGSLYALIALAMVIIYKTSEVLNFAQGDMAMVSTFVAYMLLESYHLPFPMAFGLSLLFAVLLGMAIEFLFLRQAENPTILGLIVITLGCEMILYGFAAWKWGAEQKSLPFPISDTRVYHVGSVVISELNLWTFVICIVAMGLLFAFFRYTKVGIAMKATQQNNVAARIMGIRTNRILMITWGISSFVGCVAGLLISPVTMQPFMMWDPLLKGFAAAVMGGMTSLPGAVVAAYLLGIIENLFGGYVSIEFKSSVAFAIIVLVLCIKPSGLFARHYVKKV